MEEQTENHQPEFNTGYTNGIEGTDPQSYKSYLASNTSQEWFSEQLAQKKEALAVNQSEYKEAALLHKNAFDKLQNELRGLNSQTQLESQIEQSIADIDTTSETLRAKREEKGPSYSLIAGLIFLAAGVSFIAGDLIISHEIVAYALNIRNSNEAWAFAIGLAMLSVLLKPAYDRLIEEPFHNEDSPKAKSRYAGFKLTLSVFAIVTLIVLGWFRYEAYRTDKLKEAINKSVKSLQLNAVDPLTGAPINSPELTNKIEQALQNSDQLNLDLVNSPWALLSFVLSGVLFAIAGAVSLGMALPVLQGFWYRWLQADPKLWRLKRRRKKLVAQLAAVQEKIHEHVSQKNIHENDLNLIPSLTKLKEEETNLRMAIEKLESELREAMTNSRQDLFESGYAHGQVSRAVMSEEEYDEWRNSHLTVSNLALRAKANSSSDRAVTRTKNTGMRPHQAIRKAITDRLDDNNF